MSYKSYRSYIAVLALGLVIGLGFSTMWRASLGPVHRTDYTVYREAGRAVIEGTDLYQAENSRGWRYVYPPPFAILMVPFAKMSVFWGALTWYLLSVGLMAWAVRMSATLADARPDPGVAPDVRRGFVGTGSRRLWLGAIPMLLVLGWFMSGVTRGQASIVVAWLVTAAVYWHFRGKDVAGGVCLAGAILIKVFPAVLLAYFVWKRRWRFLAAAAAALIVAGLLLPALAVGWRQNETWWREWVGVVAAPAVARTEVRRQSDLNDQLLDLKKPRNQSLAAVAYRLTNGGPGREIAAVAALVMVALMVWVTRGAPAEAEPMVASAAVVWTLLVPPISESHYFVMLLLPLALLTATAWGPADRCARRVAIGALATFGIVSLVSISLKFTEIYGPLCWATLLVWGGLLIVVARRRQPGKEAT